MCIAIYSLKGNLLPSEEALRNSFESNPDGCGFSYAYKGTVYTYKGFFKFDTFYERLMECDKKYNLKNCGVLLHFRIATHGSIVAANCHPFPLSSNENKLKSSYTKSKYAVIHNGICSCTTDAAKKGVLSDTALFVRDYLSKIATFDNWFSNPHTIKLIEQLIESKLAILRNDGEIISTDGFHKGNDGNHYSNYSYMERGFGLYSCGFLDDWYGECYGPNEEAYVMPLMELKPQECIYYNDGNVEEYRTDYHPLYRTFVTEECEVYTLFERGDFEDRIPFEKLCYVGEGEIVDSFFSIPKDSIKMSVFRQDAVAFI